MANQSLFDEYKLISENGSEYWSARDLYKILDYKKWDKFLNVIDKAKEVCKLSGFDTADHFPRVEKMIELGKNATRDIGDLQLSRYACYLIVQNADSSKPIVALGQTYFAVQTRKQEILESEKYNSLKNDNEKRIYLRNEMKNHNLQLASAAKKAGVIKPVDYAIFQDHGYKGLYGGFGAKDIHKRKNLTKSQNILDHMGSAELAANLFRATQTEEKLKRENISSKHEANKIHNDVGKKVRQTIKEIGGTMPEDLPAAESIKKLQNKKPNKITSGNKKK